jgi:hypothetical protein
MNRTIKLSKYCCADCGGYRVETLDWVTVNGNELVGGDLGQDYWCPDCEAHPSAIEQRAIVVGVDGSVERCRQCNIHASDEEAALFVAAEIARRGGKPRVAIVVGGWDTCKPPSAI